MKNPILDDNTSSLFEQAVKSSKQASVVKKAPQDEHFSLNPVLDTKGDISLSPATDLNIDTNALTLGSLREKPLDSESFLALLLDPEDISALLESNIEQTPIEKEPEINPLFSGTQNHSILKIEDVLHKEDSLDELLPPNEDDRWYLYGSERAIDKAISGPGIQDIHDALLMQQLAAQNYVE
jgi:hypothetical protein